MKFSIDKKGNNAIFFIEEKNCNSLVAPEIKSELIILKNLGIKNLVLDLSSVIFVDSSGLSAILTGDRIWKDEGKFIVTGIDAPMVKKLFEISRLDSVICFKDSIEEALDFINESSIGDYDEDDEEVIGEATSDF